MPAYKYTLKSGKVKWYASFLFRDWTGKNVRIVRRGFNTQRDAKDFEQNYKDRGQDRSDILFGNLVENYLEDMEHRLRFTTMDNKRQIFDTKILPFFAQTRVCDIDALKIRKWQNELLEMKDDGVPYKKTYLKTINNQMSAILNYAVRNYGLKVNPCHITGSIGANHAEEMKIWTKDQFELFLTFVKSLRYRLAFDVLFYTGMRSGELLALTPEDILETSEIRICKTYVQKDGKEYINPAKTARGNRVVSIPETLYDDLMGYISKLYGIQPTDRLFLMTKNSLLNNLHIGGERAGLERIRVHDLRHSNASMLINMGVDIMEISRRLGHESTKTTWDTYGHLYPDSDKKIAMELEMMRKSSRNQD